MVRIPRLDLGAPALIDTFATPRRHRAPADGHHEGLGPLIAESQTAQRSTPLLVLSGYLASHRRSTATGVRKSVERSEMARRPLAVSIASNRSSRLPPRPPSGAMHDTGSPLAFSGGRTRAAAVPQAVPHDGTDRSGLGWNEGPPNSSHRPTVWDCLGAAGAGHHGGAAGQRRAEPPRTGLNSGR